MWLMGQYVVAALDATVCNIMPYVKRRQKGKYPDEPIRVIPKTKEEKEADEMRELQKFLGFAGDFEKDVKRRTKGE